MAKKKKITTKLPRNPLFVPNEKHDKMRQAYNALILGHLQEYLRRYPELRFGQALCNLGILGNPRETQPNMFNEEPWETYKRLRETLCIDTD